MPVYSYVPKVNRGFLKRVYDNHVLGLAYMWNAINTISLTELECREMLLFEER